MTYRLYIACLLGLIGGIFMRLIYLSYGVRCKNIKITEESSLQFLALRYYSSRSVAQSC